MAKIERKSRSSRDVDPRWSGRELMGRTRTGRPTARRCAELGFLVWTGPQARLSGHRRQFASRPGCRYGSVEVR